MFTGVEQVTEVVLRVGCVFGPAWAVVIVIIVIVLVLATRFVLVHFHAKHGLKTTGSARNFGATVVEGLAVSIHVIAGGRDVQRRSAGITSHANHRVVPRRELVYHLLRADIPEADDLVVCRTSEDH